MKTSPNKFFVLPFARLAMEHDSYEHTKVRQKTGMVTKNLFDSDSIFSLVKNIYYSQKFSKIYKNLVYDREDIDSEVYYPKYSYFRGNITQRTFFENILGGFGSYTDQVIDIITVLRSTASDKNLDDFVSLMEKLKAKNMVIILPVCMGREFYMRLADQVDARLKSQNMQPLESNKNVILIKSFSENLSNLSELIYRALTKFHLDRSDIKIISLDSQITSEAITASNAVISSPFRNNNLWYQNAFWSIKDQEASEDISNDNSVTISNDDPLVPSRQFSPNTPRGSDSDSEAKGKKQNDSINSSDPKLPEVASNLPNSTNAQSVTSTNVVARPDSIMRDNKRNVFIDLTKTS